MGDHPRRRGTRPALCERLVFIGVCLWCSGVPAHYVGLSDAALEVTRTGVRVIHTLPEAELAELPSTSGPDRAGPKRLEQVADGWEVRVDGAPCRAAERSMRPLPDLAAVQFMLRYDCGAPTREVTFDYRLATDFADGHVTFARIYLASQPLTFRFRADRSRFVLPVERILARTGLVLREEFRGDDPNADLAAADNPSEARSAERMGATSPFAGIRPPEAAPGLFTLGTRHILEGPDHIAFIVGLLLVPAGVRTLLALITMFTVAHSVTLALAYYRVIQVSPSVTEPLIALSIVVIGLEPLALGGRVAMRPGVRVLTVFAFGLMHGVGLSYQISALPVLTNLEGVVRLGLFNLGVEAGQLAILAVAGAPLAWALRRSWGHHVTLVGASALVGLGSYWLLIRTLFA